MIAKALAQQDVNHNLEADGFTIVANSIPQAVRDNIMAAISSPAGSRQRGLLANPEIGCLARSPTILNHLRPHFEEDPLPVRAIFFDKCSDKNWFVAWHQDVTLAVRERAEVPGFGPWTVKDGIPHVHAPAEILRQMLTVRIHLDDADETNGALRVIPGSHSRGKLSQEQIAHAIELTPAHLCRVRVGDLLLMRPLLLHASHKSMSQTRRRVLHIEYASFKLPAPLDWHDAA